MLKKDITHSLFIKSKNYDRFKKFKLPISNINSQSRNYQNTLINDKNLSNYSMYSTKETTPKSEYNQIDRQIISQETCSNKSKEIHIKNHLDDSLSQISQLLDNIKDLDYSTLLGKISGINDEENFIYDQILFNKSRLNKAKKLSHKIDLIKLPISKISSKEGLTNPAREKKCFSDRVKGMGNLMQNEKNNDDNAGFSCCFFRRK